MAKIHLRDICDHLSAAAEVEGIVDALLAYLRAFQSDWHPTIALVDGQHDCVTRIFQRERGRLDHRDVTIPVEHLPARLVRKFFRPSAFFNAGERRSLLTKVFRVTPVYEPDRFEAPQIQPLVAPVPWSSCIVLPLADQDDLLALLAAIALATFGQAGVQPPRERAGATKASGHVPPRSPRPAAAGRPSPASSGLRSGQNTG